MNMSQLWKLYTLSITLLTISLLAPSHCLATSYTVSGNFWGADGGEVFGTLSINDSFSSSTIENAWTNYLSTPTQDDFFQELEYQITFFDLYRTDTGESFFHGEDGFIEVIVVGQQSDSAPNATDYNAWGLRGSGTFSGAYSGRWGEDVIFSNNGINVSDFEYAQLPQMIQLNSGSFFDDYPFGEAGLDLTLTATQPIPEPNTLLLLGLGTLLLTKKRKNSDSISKSN